MVCSVPLVAGMLFLPCLYLALSPYQAMQLLYLALPSLGPSRLARLHDPPPACLPQPLPSLLAAPPQPFVLYLTLPLLAPSRGREADATVHQMTTLASRLFFPHRVSGYSQPWSMHDDY